MTRSLLIFAVAVLALLAGVGDVLAQDAEVRGISTDWQWGFQDAASPIMVDIHWFYDWYLLPMMIIISAFVAGLMGYIFIKFRRSANPKPSRNTNNTLLEVLWTGVPILILIGIVIPSLRLLYFEEIVPEADMTVVATGNQWFWSYEYPDQGGIEFDSFLVPEDELEAGQPRLLTTDTQVVLPAGKVIHFLVTSSDVIHSWALPAGGIKTDAVPGRVNDFWLEISDPGIYYGQCSELCGVSHGYMPIMVDVRSPEDFDLWVADQQAALGIEPEVDLASTAQD
ncbi:MAG: cytochrome c oxidase subunit II [Alphaproteobacteria bacterium]